MTQARCRQRGPGWRAACMAACFVLAVQGFAHAAPASVYLEELTTTELQARIAGGATTALLPIGGTEQNDPHLVLGKHNVRAQLLAGRIATRLGNAIVATANGAVLAIKVGAEPHGLTVWPQPGRYSLGHTGNLR